MNEDLQELLVQLASAPSALSNLVKSLTIESLVLKPCRDEFSALENVCHLRDIEQEAYAVRIKRILEEDDPHLVDVDGTRLAIERDYNRESLEPALNAFAVARQQNLAMLRQTPAEQFVRTGVMEGLGQITLYKLVEIMNEHDTAHLEEIERCRRLFKLSS